MFREGTASGQLLLNCDVALLILIKMPHVELQLRRRKHTLSCCYDGIDRIERNELRPHLNSVLESVQKSLERHLISALQESHHVNSDPTRIRPSRYR